jgi:hypothetical protein
VAFTNLSGADLSGADLSGADLRGARLHNADLAGANLSEADLRRADLSDALLGLADLSGADLGSADLSNANLRSTDNLSEADLRSADLRSADLSYVEGISRTELEQQTESLEGATMPDRTIIAGRYATWPPVGFQPPLSFSVSDGWRVYDREMPDALVIVGPEEGSSLAFTSSLHVFDPSTLSEPKEVAAPENADEWVSWFQRHPNLDTSKPVPVSVGGASGMRIDVTYASTPENYPRDVCGEQPCVPLYPSVESANLSYAGWKDRFVIVDVGGETVIIDVAAPTDKFDEFLPKAQKVLDTVEWSESE